MVKNQIILSLTMAAFFISSGIAYSENYKIIENKTANVSGYAKPDLLFTDRLRIYGQGGKYKGEIRPDPLFKDRMRIYDSDGKYKGQLRSDPLYHDNTPRTIDRGKQTSGED